MGAFPSGRGGGSGGPDGGGPRSVSVLGSTGSVGRATLDLVARNPDAFRVEALTANTDDAALADQALRFRPAFVAIGDASRHAALRERLAGSGVRVEAGRDALVEAARRPAGWVMAAIVGAAGLEPTLAAVRRGAAVALANKECLVCAGALLIEEVRAAGGVLLPVDSEHNAIFQVFDSTRPETVDRLILTASGGPFRAAGRAEMARATPAQAVAHPVWSMGAKISVDSATMMNKGLETIEASRCSACRRSGSTSWSIPSRWCTAWSPMWTAPCWPSWGRRTCASRSPTRWPGRRGCRRPPRGSTSPNWGGWTSSGRTRTVSRRCGSRARRCGPAAARRRR